MQTLPEDFGVLRARGLLFDMDGTLLDSTAPMTRVWGRWADRHGLEHTRVLSAIHGRRAVESIGSCERWRQSPLRSTLTPDSIFKPSTLEKDPAVGPDR